jgi:hypothetical protein
MGYTCPNCGGWVGNNCVHSCTAGFHNSQQSYPLWYYPWIGQQTINTVDVKCMRKDCIYWHDSGYLIEAKDGKCSNKSLMFDEFGCCRCYVRDKKNDTAQN